MLHVVSNAVPPQGKQLFAYLAISKSNCLAVISSLPHSLAHSIIYANLLPALVIRTIKRIFPDFSLSIPSTRTNSTLA